MLDILINVIPALQPILDMHKAIKNVYAAETAFGDLNHILLLKGLLESTDSVLHGIVQYVEEQLWQQQSLCKKMCGYRKPLQHMFDTIKEIRKFGGALQWLQGQRFKSQYYTSEDDDAGDDAEFFQTGVLVFRCDVHLDILVTLCQDLGQLGQNKYSDVLQYLKKPLPSILPKTAKKLTALKRMTQLVSYGDSSLPIDALNSLLQSFKPTDTETIVSRAIRLALQYAENVCIRSHARELVSGFNFKSVVVRWFQYRIVFSFATAHWPSAWCACRRRTRRPC